MPSIRIRQQLHQFARTCASQPGLQVAFARRMVRRDAVNPPHRVSVVEIDFPPDLLWYRLRSFNHLSVDVGDIEISVGRIREVAWTEPNVRRREELHAIPGAMRRERRTVLP